MFTQSQLSNLFPENKLFQKTKEVPRVCEKVLDSHEQGLINYLTTGMPAQSSFSLVLKNIFPLAKDKRLTLEQAMLEIQNLNRSQINVLRVLYTYGLRGDHLRAFKGPSSDIHFYTEHGVVLKSLIKDRKQPLTPEEAMERINGLTKDEVVGILRIEGIRSAVSSSFKLSSKPSVEYKIYREQIEALRACEPILNRYEENVIAYLVTGTMPYSARLKNVLDLRVDQRLTPEQAMLEIKNLNKHQLNTLEALYTYGLKGDHLRSFQGASSDKIFEIEHGIVLEFLMTHQKQLLTPEAAMERINGLTGFKVMGILVENQRRPGR